MCFFPSKTQAFLIHSSSSKPSLLCCFSLSSVPFTTKHQYRTDVPAWIGKWVAKNHDTVTSSRWWRKRETMTRILRYFTYTHTHSVHIAGKDIPPERYGVRCHVWWLISEIDPTGPEQRTKQQLQQQSEKRDTGNTMRKSKRIGIESADQSGK